VPLARQSVFTIVLRKVRPNGPWRASGRPQMEEGLCKLNDNGRWTTDGRDQDFSLLLASHELK
jgi:hypothetical protein